MTLICPFWVKHRKGQEEKVFLVPFLYMRPPAATRGPSSAPGRPGPGAESACGATR